METYGKLLNIAVPIFLTLFMVEKIVAWKRGANVIRGLDSVSSFSSGITNVVKDILGLSISIITYSWLVTKLAIFDIESSFLAVLIGFVVVDFQGYWVHRFSHEINFLWNTHIIHHSSEEFNLSCALRQSISNIFNYFTVFLLPAAILGVPTEIIAIIAPLHLFMQYWYHTQMIGKLGYWEKIIVTPSHHRVHHAINPEYIDKNYGQIFILWDRWFGSFQAELEDVSPVYGIKRPARTWNPVKINFMHFLLLLRDAWHTKNWKDKFLLWFRPTGYRPEDVKEKFPVYSIEDVYNLEKYDVKTSRRFIAWSWAQMLFNYFLLIYFFQFISEIGAPHIFIYGAFIFLSVYAYSELMDGNRNAMYIEIFKSIIGLVFIYFYGDWFGANGHWPFYTYAVAGYMIFSAAIASWFALTEFKDNAVPSVERVEMN